MTGEGIPLFRDTFFGRQDKGLMDRINIDLTRIRATDIIYYVKLDQSRRIDGDAPRQNARGVDPILGLKKRSGSPEIAAMYGEPIKVGDRIDGTRRKVEHDWNYADGVRVRAIAMQPSTDENADERGTTYEKRLRCDIARVIAEELNIRPRQGDVVQLVSLLGYYYDVADVSRDETRFGGDGTFHVYQCDLVRNLKFVAPRKILPGGPGQENEP